MNPTRRRALLSSAAALSLPWLGAGRAAAQTPVALPRTVFGFTLGSTAATLYAEMAKVLQQQNPAVAARLAPVLTQHSGASGSRAIELVSKSPADGRTLLLAPSSTLTLLPTVRRLKTKPLSELVAITPLAEFTLAFCVGKSVPATVTNMASYLAWVKENPGKENYGVPAIGSSTHLLGEQIAHTSQVRLRASGYTGTAPLTEDIVGGNIAAGLLVLGNALPLMASGAVRILGVASAERWVGLPQIPTLKEQKVISFPYTENFGLYAPLGTPADWVAEVAKAVSGVMQSAPMQGPLAAAGFKAMPLQPGPFAAELQAEVATYAEQVELMQFKAD